MVEAEAKQPEKRPTLGVQSTKQIGFLKKKVVMPKKAGEAPQKPPAQGTFENNDMPEKVIGAKMSNGAI